MASKQTSAPPAADALPGVPSSSGGPGELIPMRPDERLDVPRVAAWLAGKLPGAEGQPEIWQFEGGKANLTYLLRYATAGSEVLEYVLRRPPLGPIAPKSHDMSREYKVLSRLYRAFPLAPRAYLFSEDEAVVGAPFLVMQRHRGIVIRKDLPAAAQGNAEVARRISAMLVETLADLHSVEPAAVDLADLGRPAGFMSRQIKGWAARWEAAKTGDVPDFDAVHQWLQTHVPPEPPPGLVHNDFKLDNVMVSASDPGTPVAVFDWDMCTLGDPLADLGTLLGYWTQAGDPPARAAFATMPSAEPGFLSRDEATQVYAARSGRDVSHIRFYEVYGLWKTAVIIQQIYVRWHRGQTQDARFRDYGTRAASLATAALLRSGG